MIRRTPESLAKWARCIGYEPHSKQHDCIAAYARGVKRILPICGRRWGKSDISAFIASYALCETDVRIWIIAPSYDLATRPWFKLEPIIGRVFGGSARIGTSPWGMPTVTTKWGGVLELKSADRPKSLLGGGPRSDGLDLVIMEEAAQLPERIWSQYTMPGLADRDGDAIFPTTPKGHNWIYKLFEFGQPGGDERYFSVQAPSMDNPHLPVEFFVEARRTTDPTVWRQEYEAQFVSFAGQVYSTFDRARHVIDDLPDLSGWTISAAVDPGLANPTAILWIAHNPISNEDIVVGEVVQSGLLFDDVLRLLNERRPPQGYEYLVCDVAGKARSQETGTSFMGWMKARGMHFKAHAQGIVEGINCVRSRMLNTDNAISLRFCGPQAPATVSACENYHYAEGDGPVSEEPEKDNINDHPMDALRYYCTYRYARKPGRSWQT